MIENIMLGGMQKNSLPEDSILTLRQVTALLSAIVVGQLYLGPNLLQTDYLVDGAVDSALVTVTEVLWDKNLPELPAE